MTTKFVVYDGTVVTDYLDKRNYVIDLNGMNWLQEEIPLVKDFQFITGAEITCIPIIDTENKEITVEIENETLKQLGFDSPYNLAVGIGLNANKCEPYKSDHIRIITNERTCECHVEEYKDLMLCTESELICVWIGSRKEYPDGTKNCICPRCHIDGKSLKTLAENTAKVANAAAITSEQLKDMVNHPSHYTSHPSGVECIQITEHYDFCVGNAIKYLWRAGLKSEEGKSNIEKEIEDLQKAKWYIEREISRLEGERK